MKPTRFFPILFLFFSIPLFAQPYLNESCEWYEFSGDFAGGYLNVSKLTVQGDTLIENKTYWKILEVYDNYYWGVFGGDTTVMEDLQYFHFVREDSSSFYSWWGAAEHKIVSFDYEVGDTVFLFPEGFDQVITEVENIEIGGETRKILHTDMGNEIYEGIGTNQSLLGGLAFDGEEAYTYLKCFSLNGEWREMTTFTYGHPQVETCDSVFFTGTGFEPRPASGISVFPNPASGQMTLSGSLDFRGKTLRLFDLAGRAYPIRFEEKGFGEMTLRPDENLPPGMYFLSVGDGAGRSFVRFVRQ